MQVWACEGQLFLKLVNISRVKCCGHLQFIPSVATISSSKSLFNKFYFSQLALMKLSNFLYVPHIHTLYVDRWHFLGKIHTYSLLMIFLLSSRNMVWDINFSVFKGKQEASHDGCELDPTVTGLNLLVVWVPRLPVIPTPLRAQPFHSSLTTWNHSLLMEK